MEKNFPHTWTNFFTLGQIFKHFFLLFINNHWEFSNKISVWKKKWTNILPMEKTRTIWKNYFFFIVSLKERDWSDQNFYTSSKIKQNYAFINLSTCFQVTVRKRRCSRRWKKRSNLMPVVLVKVSVQQKWLLLRKCQTERLKWLKLLRNLKNQTKSQVFSQS